MDNGNQWISESYGFEDPLDLRIVWIKGLGMNLWN